MASTDSEEPENVIILNYVNNTPVDFVGTNNRHLLFWGPSFAIANIEKFQKEDNGQPIRFLLPLLPPPAIQSEQPASTEEVESMEEDYPGNEADDVLRSLPFTDGETRMVMVKVREKDCWAMLLSQEMAHHVNLVNKQSRAVGERDPAVDEAATEVFTIDMTIEEAEDGFKRTEGQKNGNCSLRSMNCRSSCVKRTIGERYSKKTWNLINRGLNARKV